MLEIESLASMASRAASPKTYRFGEFIRLVRDPNFWGRIVGPSDLPGRWMFEYPHGARVTVDASALETFEPTAAQRNLTEPRFEHLRAIYRVDRPSWPEGYTV
jgi:hypothetical protein